jgi:tetratricopeptide (TPR) repeat protein
MAFVDALIAACDVEVLMVDRRHGPGGHWNDAYPFVRLHGPSALYGVNSRRLGTDAIDQGGPNAGYYPRATAAEICGYYQRVLDEQLLPCGRVRFLGMSDCSAAGNGPQVTSRLTGETTTIRVRKRVVDARYLEPSIPATHVPPFGVEPGARLIPVNDLVGLSSPASGFTILGGGKTAIDGTAERAARLLDLLVRAHLIQPVRPGRYGMHDLLRAYALGLTAENGHDERRTALTRLFDHYLCAAATAMDALFPAEAHRRPRIPPSGASPPLIGPAAARKWLDTERANLAATARNTADAGWPDHTVRLAATLFRYLDVGGHYTEGTVIHRHARRAARTTGDRAAEAIALTNLATIELRQGRNLRATGHLQEALALFDQAGDHSGRARTLSNLGIASMQQGQYEQATGHFSQALALFSEAGDQTGQARAQGNLGVINLREGSYQQANRHLQQTLTLCRQARDPTGQAYALRNLGGLDMKQGYYEQAIRHLQQAFALFRKTSDRTGEAYTLSGLGDVYLRQGNHQQAITHHRQALTLFRELGDRPGEAEALNGLGEILSATGHPGHASAQHMAALDIADQINDQLQRARAREGLSNAQRLAWMTRQWPAPTLRCSQWLLECHHGPFGHIDTAAGRAGADPVRRWPGGRGLEVGVDVCRWRHS